MLSKRYTKENSITAWLDISDLVIPTEFITKIFSAMNQIREGRVYTDVAYEELQDIFIAVAQKVLRAMTEEEWKRAGMLRHYKI